MRFLFARLFVLVFILLLLAACEGQQAQASVLEEAVADGMILSANDIGRVADVVHVGEAIVFSALLPYQSFTAYVGFAVDLDLSFKQPNRFFGEFFVEVGQFVQAGDLLAESYYEPTGFQLAQRQAAQRDLQRFESGFILEYHRLQAELQESRLAVPADDNWENYAIALSIAELSLELFMLESERERRELRERLEHIEGEISGEQILAPFDGLITGRAAIMPGAALAEDREIVSIVDTASIYFRLARSFFVSNEQWKAIVRYGDVFNVVHHGIEFEVQVVNDPIAAGDGRDTFYLRPLSWEGIERILYVYADNWNLFLNITLEALPRWNMFGEGIILPERAIMEDMRGSYVFVSEDGRVGRRYVTVGPYMVNRQVYIISGLVPGQRVFTR